MAAGQVAMATGGTVIGVNVLVPIVGYGGQLFVLPPMSVEVQTSIATVLAGLVTVLAFVCRALWIKFLGPVVADPGNSAGA